MSMPREVPELEALMPGPWCCTTSTSTVNTRLIEVGKIRDDDVIAVFYPAIGVLRSSAASNPGILGNRTRQSRAAGETPTRAFRVACRPAMPACTATRSARRRERRSRCTNEDLVRNALQWSPMSCTGDRRQDGIECRLYTERSLEDISLQAGTRARAHAGREPDEIGAVIC